MYVDDDTSTDTTEDTTDDSYGDDSTDTDTGASDDVLEVEIDGETYTVEETYDMDEDGANDTAVVETGDGGVVAYADTDHDGTADVAVEYDADGNPVAAAEYDDTTGEWTAADVEDLPPATGDGADDADGSSTDTTDTTDTDTTGTSTDGESITVDMEQDVDAGPATYDTDGDGTNDTAVVTDADGTTYAFTDADGDGVADQAVVIEADGDVTVAEHTGEDEWTTTETGEINAEGEYVPDDTSSSASSDAVWADR